MARRAFWISIAAGVSGTVWLLWGAALPLGVPGEWEWRRLPADAQSAWNLAWALVVAAAYLGFVAWGGRRLAHADPPRAETALWLGALPVAGFWWLWCVQETAPPAGQLGKAPFVLYYPSSSGYFYKARYDAPDVGQFLADYERLMQSGDVLHVGTHPPGLFLVFHGLLRLVDACPALVAGLTALAPESVRAAQAIVAENTAATSRPLTPSDGAVLWLATLLVQAAAAATVLPLYGLLRVALPRSAAWWGAAAWPAVPAVAIFIPKSDAAFPLLATLLVWTAWNAARRDSLAWGVAAGVVSAAALLCSLAFLPVGLCAALAIGASYVTAPPQSGRRRIAWRWFVGAVAGLVVPCAVLSLCGRINLWHVWLWNYHNHARFYAEYRRTYACWLAVNPLELALAVGWPAWIAGSAGCWRVWRTRRSRPEAWPLAVASVCVMVLLWLSGKNSGEAARLWLLLLPGVVWLAGHAWPGAEAADAPKTLRWERAAWLALQLLASILTVHRVGGFHFG